jgi:hypothetical protein
LGNERVLLGTQRGTVLEYDLKANRVVKEHSVSDGPVFLEDSTGEMIVGSTGNRGILIDVRRWKRRDMNVVTSVATLALSPDKKKAFVSSDRSGEIECCDLVENKSLWRCRIPNWSDTSRTCSLSCSTDSARLLVVGSGFRDRSDRRVVVLDCAKGKIVADYSDIKCPRGLLCAGSFFPSSNEKAILSSGEETLLLLDLVTGQTSRIGHLKQEAMKHSVFTKIGVVPVVTFGGTLELLDWSKWTALESMNIVEGAIFDIRRTDDECVIAFVSREEKWSHLYVIDLKKYLPRREHNSEKRPKR